MKKTSCFCQHVLYLFMALLCYPIVVPVDYTCLMVPVSASSLCTSPHQTKRIKACWGRWLSSPKRVCPHDLIIIEKTLVYPGGSWYSTYFWFCPMGCCSSAKMKTNPVVLLSILIACSCAKTKTKPRMKVFSRSRSFL